MSNKHFNFELYRLNVVDDDAPFSVGKRLRGDDSIVRVFDNAAQHQFDNISDYRNIQYQWSLRLFKDWSHTINDRHIATVFFAKSVIKKNGLIITDSGIEDGTSSSLPPLADALLMIIDFKRHLVAIESKYSIINNENWKKAFVSILWDSSINLKYSSKIELEEVPEKNEILDLFNSFEKLTRLKVTLRIPNPELTRLTKGLYDELTENGIREYSQEMKNPNGLSKSEEHRPYVSAALAQAGYKKNEVTFEGYREGEYTTIKSGVDAAKGKIDVLKDYIRGLAANTVTKEGNRILKAITAEIDRIHPVEGIDEK